MALLFPIGSHWGGVAGGVLNLALSMAEKFPYSLRRFLPPLVLLINTVLSAYGVLTGGLVTWAVLVAGLSLLSWNAGLFGQRWGDASGPVQSHYLKRVGILTVLGLGAGLSALVFRGNLSLPFPLTLGVMLVSGVFFLRLISGSFQKAK
jgi:low temperature requirement protein LtrA